MLPPPLILELIQRKVLDLRDESGLNVDTCMKYCVSWCNKKTKQKEDKNHVMRTALQSSMNGQR